MAIQIEDGDPEYVERRNKTDDEDRNTEPNSRPEGNEEHIKLKAKLNKIEHSAMGTLAHVTDSRGKVRIPPVK